MRHVSANGIEIACEITGSGPPIVLCHGGEADHRNFYNFAPLLARDFTVIGFDQRDTGETHNGEADYSLAECGQDVGALITALGFKRAHVFGASWGGVIAQHAALECPDRVDHLILSVTWPGGEMQVREDFLKFVMAQKTPEEQRCYYLMFFGDAYARDHAEEAIAHMTRAVVTRTPEQRARRGKNAFAHDARARLPGLKCPTLVLTGSDDKIVVPDQPRKLAALIPNAKFVSLEGVGHATTIEAPERVAEEVRKFILGG